MLKMELICDKTFFLFQNNHGSGSGSVVPCGNGCGLAGDGVKLHLGEKIWFLFQKQPH
jgi:hypothetical protein